MLTRIMSKLFELITTHEFYEDLSELKFSKSIFEEASELFIQKTSTI